MSSPSCSGTLVGYSVEGRWNYPAPKMFGDQILDKEWRTLKFQEGAGGVPTNGCMSSERQYLAQYGLFTQPAAEALRWWFIANAEASEFGMFCLETRIVKHLIKYSSSAERTEEINYQPPKKDAP
jgi:hypothetical protein